MRKLLIAFLVVFSLFAISCEIGLGSAVDTEPPAIEISIPPVDSVIRDNFAIGGTWSDDGVIGSISVKLSRTDGKGEPLTLTGEFVEDEKKRGSGTWTSPVSISENNVLDGTYQAVVTIKDTVGRTTIQSTTFTVDNTAPLIVLQRPGTKLTETADAYGQTFSLNGMGADDNSIDHIDINIYSDEECTNLLKTITKSNVPPTIELDVAVFEDGVENDYATIYGSTGKNGMQTRYCTIQAYDNAKRYPLTGEMTDEDQKGNSTSFYYLYDDIYDSILDNYTITDVYKMLSGTYLLADSNRSADTVANVKALLGQFKITEGNFSLNPENNPQFIVNGRDPLTKSGSDFAGSDYNITSGSSVVVEISTGLDGIPLEPSSLRPYLLLCDANGDPQVEDKAENRIYLAEAGSGTKSGTSYKYTVNFNHTTAYPNGKFIYLGNTYIIRVEGYDKNRNTIIPKGGAYGFKLSSNGAAPGLTVTKPATTISYVKANGKQTFEGIITSQDGFPTITIRNGSEVIWTKSFTHGDETNVNGILRFDFSHDIDYNGVTENSQIQYTVVASMGDLETTTFKTVIYDKDAPTVSLNEPSPIAAKYITDDPDNEDNTLVGENYLNGNVKLKVSINDEYDAVDTETEGKKPYFEIINAQTNAVIPIKLEASSHVVEESEPTEKHYVTRLVNGEFIFNTAGEQGIADNTPVKFKFHAWDRAGNEIEYSYPEASYDATDRTSYYIVDQSTDTPVILPNDEEISLLLTSKALRDARATAWTDQNRTRRAQVSSGNQFMIKMIDDDGIKSWEIYRATIDSSNEGELANQVADNRFTLDSSSGNTSLNSKEITKSVTVQTTSGYYWYKIKVVDKNNKEFIHPVFIVKVTTAAPSITLSSVTTDTDPAVGEYVGATGATKTKWKNKIEIDSSEESFTLYRAVATINSNGNYEEPAEADYEIITTADSKTINDVIERGSYESNQRFYYYVRDNNGNKGNIKYITCKYDGVAPTLAITGPDDTKKNTNAINSSPYQFRGTITEDKSISSIYYKVVAANADGSYTAPAIDSWTGWTSVSPEANWSFYRDIGSANGAIAEGKYKIYMYALDGAGNLSERAEREFHVDLAAPVVTATAPEYVNYSTNTDHSGKVTITGTVVETHGIASFYIKRNDQAEPGTSVAIDDNGEWTYENTPENPGTYTYTITATDKVGKTNTTLTKTVTVDVTAPSVDAAKITTPTSTQTENEMFKFEGQAGCVSDNEGGSGLDKVELAFTTTNSEPTTKQTDTTPVLTGDAIGSWASTVEFANTTFGGVFSSEGTKYIWVKVYDKAGNSSAWIPKEFLYDTGVPGFNLTATTPAADSYKNTGFTIEGRATDSYGIGSVVIKGEVELTDTPDNWENAYTNYYTDQACTTPAPATFAAGTYYVKQTLTTPATITTSTDGRIQNALYSKAFRVGTETTSGAVLLADGSYNFIVTATDLSGKSKTESRRIIIDTTEPDGTFDTDSFYPLGNSVGSGANARTWYNSNSITITVNVTEANISTVKILKDNSTFEPMLLSNGNYTATVRNLAEGQNTIYVQMVDLATNNKIINLENLYVDTNAPNLSINENTILTYMGTTGFTVTGEVSDAGTTETPETPVTGSGIGTSGLRVKEEHRETLADSWAETADSSNSNGGAVISVTNGTWSQDLPLNPANLQNGYYRYTFILTDNAGNQTSEYKTTIVDTTPPVITISNPGENAKTNTNAINTSPYQFSGSITETNTVSAIYYKVVAANADGSFTAPSNESWTGWTSVSSEKDWSFYRDIGTADGAIGEGKYKIYMYALDGAGNLSERAEREFHVDMAAPVVTATAPEYVNYSTNTDHSRKVTITGTVVETHGIASFYIKRNDQAEPGTSVAIGANGNWTYEDTPTADETYTYTIVATDKVGKTNTTLTKTVIIDTVAPSVVAANIIVPTNGSQTEGTHFKFEGGTGCVADNNGGSGLDKVEIAFTSTNSAPSTKQAEATPVTTGDTIGSWASTVEFANATFGSVFGSEGTKYIWVKVYDKAGNSSAWTSKEFLYDTGAPGLTLTATTPVTNSYRNSGFTIEGRATDSYGIGSVVIKGEVELTDTPDNWANAYTNYYTNEACTTPAPAAFTAGTYYVKQTATTTSTDSPVTSALYSKAFRVGTETTAGAVLLADGSYNFTVTATDLSGKTVSENRTITIEREQPNLNNIKLIIGVDEANNDIEAYRQSESTPYFINNTTSTDLKITGVATDNIGINSVTISIAGLAYSGANTGSNARWKFEHINLSSMSNVSGTDATATITVTDKAGNTTSDTVDICFDTTPPTGQHEIDSSEKDLFFRIGDNDNDDITSSHELWNATKDTDVGKKYSDKTYGNSDTIEIRGKITDPQAVASTEEAGSGVKMIYYHVFDRPVLLDSNYTDKQNVTGNGIIVNGVSTDNVPCWGFADETALTNWVISNKTGNFAPGTPDTKRVFYNVDGSDPFNGTPFTTTKYYKDVVTTYRASLSGFENSNNYLVIAAEDNVGNKGLDSATVTTDSGDLLKIFCQINKDVTPPDVKLNENEESTRYHNASSTGNSITLHGTVTDDLAGIRGLKFRVNGKFIPNEEENQPSDKYGTITTSYNATKTSGTWTLTIKPSALAGTTGNTPVYGIATDDAGIGNSQTLSVATICVDVTPPTVKITAPKDRGAGSAEYRQINGTISLNGTASDRNGLKEETTTQTMQLYYTTSSILSTNLANALTAYNDAPSTATYPALTTGEDGTEADTKWIPIGTASHDTSWIFTNIDTTKLDGSTAIADNTTVYFTVSAIDQAGNTGYATPITVIVDQNTDRPTVSFSNLELGPTMSSINYIWLKNTTKVIGTISDDDDDETGTNTLEIGLLGSDSTITWRTVTLNGSSFSYDLKNFYTATATETTETQANGEKTIYFRVTDKKGKTFTSSATNTTSALYLSDGTNTYGGGTSGETAASIVYVKVDTQYPEVALLGAKYTGNADTTYSTSYSSFVIGENHKSITVKFTASDTNGIDNSSISGTAEFPYGSGANASSITVNSTDLTPPTNATPYYTLTFEIPAADVITLKAGTGYAGSVNVRISVSDTAGNATPQTATLAYDFKPSVAGFSFPDSLISQSGEVEAYGSLSEAATVSYTISPSQTISAGGSVETWLDADGTATDLAEAKTVEDWKPISDATGLNWTIHFDNKLSETNGTHSKSLNKYLIDYGIAARDTGSSAEDAIVSDFETFVKLYLWIKTVDHAGNEKTFVHQILVDPQGDKPNLQFSYPAVNNGTLGGTVSIYGTATDTKGSEANKIGVDSVWVQIKSTTHRAAEDTDTYGTSPTYASDTNTVSMALTEADLDYMVNNGYQVYKRRNYVVGAADSVNNAFKWTTSSNLTAGESADDYAALATLNGAAWDIEINKKSISGRSEFDPPEGTNSNPIAIRVYARDKDGKFSSKVDRYVSFDADTPVISDLKVVQSADGNVNSTATATKTYSPDMFLKGPWYLTGTITDNESIKELKVNGQTLITYTEPESEPNPVVRIVGGETEDTEDWRNAVSISGNDGGKTIKFKYPLFTVTQSGDISYSVPTTFTVSAKDKIKGNNAHPGSSSITINYDNTNPQVAEDEAHGLNIDTSIHQSNRWYKFGSKAMEPDDDNGTKQSGFAYTAFYFTRTSTNTLYDVLKDRNSAAISISGTIPVLGSANDTDNAIVTNNDLYWYHRTISNISGQTFTISNATGIRPSSLLQINGAFYLVTAVSGTSITVDSPVPAGSNVAYVAIAGIINNTTPEGDGTAIQTDGYYEAPSRDDGDRMIESVDKSGTTWAWEAKICSRNIPDGPIILHYVVFDKAGNSTTRTVSGMISNNQPRIAGAIVKTDFNGDGDVDDTGETINNYATSLSYSQYYTGTKTTGTEPDTVTVNVFDPDENVKNTNAKNPLPTSTTYGSASEPITVLRGKTEIYPEVVGGNGALYYGYKVGEAENYTNNTTSPFITNGSTDYTVQTGIINIQHGDLIDFGDTTNAATAKAFAFKFWDSTEGGTRFDDDNPTQTAELTMYFAVQAQAVGDPWVKINPFYWNSLTDNSIYGSSTASAYKDLQGHIELEADWKTTTVYDADATSGLYDDDPKVSGKIVLSGTAHDDKLIKEMKASIFGADPVQVASYSNGALSSTKTSADFNTNHYWFEVLSQTINSTGHDVSWKLYIDTATALSTVAGTDKSVTVTATNYGIPTATTVESTTPGSLPGIDGTTYYAADLTYATGNTNAPGTSQTAKAKDAENNPILTAYYKMDVVPYITGIRTPNRSKSGLKDSNIRSASGKYSVIKGNTSDFITVSGFNLNVSDARIVKTERLSEFTTFTADDVTLSPTNKAEDFTSFQGRNNLTKSGYLEVLVSGVRALNNINNNNSHGSLALAGATATVNEWNNFYNREPDYYSTKNVQLTDDRYILVWDMHDTGDRTKNGAYPTMFMEGDDPVFGYFNPSGGPSGNYGTGAGTGAGTTYPEYAMPQRIKFNSDGTEAYTEYLAKNSAGDQMGTGRDDSGRYYHMSVFNRGGCALYMIYDRYNEFYGGMGWAPGITIGGISNYVVTERNNGIGLETINFGGLQAGRYQYPKIIAKGRSKDATAYVYVAYYDDYYKSIVMRTFQCGTSVTGIAYQLENRTNNNVYYDLENNNDTGTKSRYAQFINFEENTSNTDNNTYSTGRLSGVGNVTGTPNENNSASKYFDMKVTSDYHIILVYYDETTSSLKLRYSTNQVTGDSPTTAIAWSENTVTFPEYVGNYVSLDLDSEDGLHMSAFDATDGNLVYMYLPSYSSTSLTKVTVDQASSVGNWTQIKLNSSDVPYIAYYNSTETGSRDSIKLAYAKNAAGSVTAGVDVVPGTISGTGYTLGGWEYMTVPSVNPAQGGNPNFQNVCLGFDTAGIPVVGYAATNLEFGKWLDE